MLGGELLAVDGGGLVIYYPVMAQRVVPARAAA
jgi:hypothetical protein